MERESPMKSWMDICVDPMFSAAALAVVPEHHDLASVFDSEHSTFSRASARAYVVV